MTVGRRWFWGGLALDKIRKPPWKPFEIADTGPDETAAILFTTGSTGGDTESLCITIGGSSKNLAKFT